MTATEDGIYRAVHGVLKAAFDAGQIWHLKGQNKDHTTNDPYVEYIHSPDRPAALVNGSDKNGFIVVNVWVPKNYGAHESLKQGETIIGLFPRGTELQAANLNGSQFTISLGVGDIEPQRRGTGDRDKWAYTTVSIRYEALNC